MPEKSRYANIGLFGRGGFRGGRGGFRGWRRFLFWQWKLIRKMNIWRRRWRWRNGEFNKKKVYDFDPGQQVKSSGAQFERSWGSWSFATHWTKRSQGVYLKRDDGSENDDDIDDVGDHDGGNGDEKFFWVSELVCPLTPAVSSTISMKILMLLFRVGVSVLCSLDNWRLISLFKAV